MVNTIIDNIDYITPNETEAGLLANMAVNDIESAKCAAKIIHQKGVKNTIITLGSKVRLLMTAHNSSIPRHFRQL